MAGKWAARNEPLEVESEITHTISHKPHRIHTGICGFAVESNIPLIGPHIPLPKAHFGRPFFRPLSKHLSLMEWHVNTGPLTLVRD